MIYGVVYNLIHKDRNSIWIQACKYLAGLRIESIDSNTQAGMGIICGFIADNIWGFHRSVLFGVTKKTQLYKIINDIIEVPRYMYSVF